MRAERSAIDSARNVGFEARTNSLDAYVYRQEGNWYVIRGTGNIINVFTRSEKQVACNERIYAQQRKV